MRYAPRLDGLRGIAILMVLLEHFAMIVGRPISAGYYGVNLFFVLSGFLITSILISNENQSFGVAFFNFIARRSLRIFPIYYLILFILFFIKAPSINDRLPYLLTYTYNYQLAYLNFPSEPYSPYWSLGVEEQFYLFFPLLVLGLRKKPNSLIILCLLFFLLSFMQLFFDVFSLMKYNYVSLLTNIAPLSSGAIGAILSKKNILPNRILQNKYSEIAVLIFILVINTCLDYKYVLIFCGIFNLYLVLKAYHFGFVVSFLDKLLLNSKLIFIGRISYGIYLYHNLIGYYFTNNIFDPIWKNIPFEQMGILSIIEYHSWLIKLPLYSFLSIIIATYSFKFIELPILKLKNKFT